MGNIICRAFNAELELKLTRMQMVQSRVLIAAAEGNFTAMKNMLDRDESLAHSADYDRRTALHLACAEGHKDIADLLIQTGVKPMVKDRWGHEPLQEAILHGHENVVDLLIGYGVILSYESKQALEQKMCDFACQGDLKRIEMLVQCGISTNSADYDKRSALHLAAASGHYEIVDYLLRSKADVNCRDRWGGTAMADAINSGNARIQQLLTSAGAAEHTGSCQEVLSRKAVKTALIEAAAAGNVEEIRRCLAQGAHVDDTDYDLRTGLHLACSEGHLLAVESLISLGARTDAVDRWGNVPLQDAMRHGHREVVDALQRFGVQLATDMAADMAVRACDLAYRGDLVGLRRLIECGVPLESTDREGRSPLHLAASMGRLDTVEYLLGRSAAVDLPSSAGATPMSLAIAGRHHSVVEALRRAGAVLPPEWSSSTSWATNHRDHIGALGESKLSQGQKRANSMTVQGSSAGAAKRSQPCISVFLARLRISGKVPSGATIPESSEAAASEPLDMAGRLRARIFDSFEKLATRHGVRRIRAVGDEYLASTNLEMDQVLCCYLTASRDAGSVSVTMQRHIQ